MTKPQLRILIKKVTNELDKEYPPTDISKVESTSGTTICDDLYALIEAAQRALIENNCLP